MSKETERIVNAERVEDLIAVFGSFDENVRRIEEALGVRIVNRGTDLKVTGDEEMADKAVRTLSGVVLSVGVVVLLTILIEGTSLNIRVSEDGRSYTGIAAFVRYYHVEWLVAVGAALVLLGAAGLIWLKLWRWWHRTP